MKPATKEYVMDVSPDMHVFDVPITVVRYGGNVCGLAMHPGIFVMEENVERVPGAACLSITMTVFEHLTVHDGFTIAGYATFASWWRKSAPAQYNRREYGGRGGWPSKEEQRARKHPWLGFRPALWRGYRE